MINIKTDLNVIENLYSDIKRIIAHVPILRGTMTFNINSKGYIIGLWFDIKTFGNPEKIRYNEYKALETLMWRKQVTEVKLGTESNKKHQEHELSIFGYPIIVDYKTENFLKIIIKYEEGKVDKYIDKISIIKESKESFKEYINFFENNGYKNKIDEEKYEISEASIRTEFVEFKLEQLYDIIKSIEVKGIDVNFSLNKRGYINESPKYIVHVNEDPENISLEEYRKIERKNVSLEYKDKKLDFINNFKGQAENVVYLSIESTPKTIVKYVTEVKGEGLEHILRVLKNKGYFDTGIK